MIRCSGRLVRSADVPEGARAMQVGSDSYLVEDPSRPQVDDYLNHSCHPNVGFSHGRPVLFALRRIKRGEELLFDYSTSMNEPGWSFPCLCRAARCRGVVQSYRDLDEGVRTRLRRTALAYLRAL